jgi:hypothetical protein
MSVAARVRMAGPLTRYAEGFAAELTAHGYTDLSLANQLRLMSDLSRWLHAAKSQVDEIDHESVTRFLAKRRRTHTQFITERALAPLLLRATRDRERRNRGIVNAETAAS